MTDDEIRAIWVGNGGRFHGPHVETATMPEAKLFELFRSFIAAIEGIKIDAVRYMSIRDADNRVCEDDQDTDTWADLGESHASAFDDIVDGRMRKLVEGV